MLAKPIGHALAFMEAQLRPGVTESSATRKREETDNPFKGFLETKNRKKEKKKSS